MPVATRKKILGINYPRFATAEFKSLEEVYDIHYFIPTDRAQVISEVKKLCEEHGPFDAGYVLFNTSAYSPFHKDMLAPLMTPGTCGIWAQGGAGYDDVDVQFLTESNCWFSNTPYAVTSSTADMALLLTLQVLRGSTEAEANARAGKWRAGLGLTKDPQGLRLGIVGMGAIGSCLATRAGALGMEVVYNNRTPLSREDEASKAGGAKWIAFDELLATSDVISMNCPLNENTRHLLGEKEFEKMKDGVFIVNTARGAVIDEEALVQALKLGKVARAGLDVFENEPKIHPFLLESLRVTLQPHVGAFTEGTISTGEKTVFANVAAYLESGKPLNPVNSVSR